jgi:hypothetical protein
MKIKGFPDSVLASGVILGAAALLLGVATLTNRSDLTTATLFLAGVGCFLGGIFMLTFVKEEPPHPGAVALLGRAESLNISRMCSDLGVRGDAWIVPGAPGGDIRQFIPVADKVPVGTLQDFSFRIQNDTPGVVLIPAGKPLLDMLMRDHNLVLPESEAGLPAVIKEVCEDVLEIANDAGAAREGDQWVITLKGYRLFEGCRYIAAVSPKCCTMNPCGICSLTGCIFTAALGRPHQITRVELLEKERGVRIFCITGAAPLSTGGDPGNSH